MVRRDQGRRGPGRPNRSHFGGSRCRGAPPGGRRPAGRGLDRCRLRGPYAPQVHRLDVPRAPGNFHRGHRVLRPVRSAPGPPAPDIRIRRAQCPAYFSTPTSTGRVAGCTAMTRMTRTSPGSSGSTSVASIQGGCPTTAPGAACLPGGADPACDRGSVTAARTAVRPESGRSCAPSRRSSRPPAASTSARRPRQLSHTSWCPVCCAGCPPRSREWRCWVTPRLLVWS